jgi:hypothetical protein
MLLPKFSCDHYRPNKILNSVVRLNNFALTCICIFEQVMISLNLGINIRFKY